MLRLPSRVFAAWRGSFAGLPRQAWILAFACWINRSGTMALTFLALWLVEEKGLAAVEAGRMQGAYGIAAMFGAWFGGALSDAIGPKRVQVISLLAGGAIFLLLGSLEASLAITLALIALGLSSEMLRPANMVAVTHIVDAAMRPRAMALLRLAINLGAASGALLGGYLAEHDFQLVFLIDGATCIGSGVFIAIFLDRHATDGSRERAEGRTLLQGAPLRDKPFVVLLLGVVVLFVMLYQLESTFSLYLRQHHGVDMRRIGFLFAINTVLIVLLEMLVVKRVEKHPPLVLAAIGTALLGLGLSVVALGGFATAVVAIVILTFGEMLWAPFLATYVLQRAGPGRRGQYLGCYTVAAALGTATAPIVGTMLYQGVAPTAPFLLCLVLGPLVTLLLLALRRAKLPVAGN
jgi:MFS family permease